MCLYAFLLCNVVSFCSFPPCLYGRCVCCHSLWWLSSYRLFSFLLLLILLYTGSVKLLADFVRAHRSMCVEILKHRTANNTSVNNNKRTSQHHVYMKNILMTEDDADDPCDAYFPMGKPLFLFI